MSLRVSPEAGHAYNSNQLSHTPHARLLLNFFPALVAAMLLMFLVACSQMRVRTEYNPSIDFANYHTYTWLKVSAGNSLWADRIRDDVNRQLQKRGWREVPSGGQATINAFGSTRQQPTLETFYNGFGPGWGGWFWGWGGLGWGYETTQVVNIPIGTLIVDMFNTADKHLIWRGNAEDVLSGNPERNAHKLDRAIKKMFDNFPWHHK